MTRIPDITTHRHLRLAVQEANWRMSRQRYDIATGIRVHTASDDLHGADRAMDGQTSGRRADGLAKATDIVEFFGKAVEAAVAGVTDLVTQARALVARAGNDGALDGDSKAALAAEANQLLESLLEEANRRGPGGTYLFGGKAATSPPYTATRDAGGNITGVTAGTGIDEPVSKPVGESTVVFPITGPGVFSLGGDAFQALVDLRDGLNGGVYAAVEAALPLLETIESNVAKQYGRLGSFMQRVTWAQGHLEDVKLSSEAQRSRAMDTDLPGAMTELSHQETLYQAALEMSSRVSELSLVKYL